MRGWEVHCAGMGGTLCWGGRYIVRGWEVHCKGVGRGWFRIMTPFRLFSH